MSDTPHAPPPEGERHEETHTGLSASEAPTADSASGSDPTSAPAPAPAQAATEPLAATSASLSTSLPLAASAASAASTSHAPTSSSSLSPSAGTSHATSPPGTDVLGVPAGLQAQAQQAHSQQPQLHTQAHEEGEMPSGEAGSGGDGSQRTSGERTAEARAAFLASLSNVGTHATAPLEQRAGDIAANNASIQRQEEAVRAEAQGLARMTAEYAKVADEARGKLKELGHVQNWAEMLERDLLVLEETMRIVDEEEAEERRNDNGKGKGRVKGTTQRTLDRDGDTVLPDANANANSDGRQGADGLLAGDAKGGGPEQKKGWKGWW